MNNEIHTLNNISPALRAPSPSERAGGEVCASAFEKFV
jgi:hypothetical protein